MSGMTRNRALTSAPLRDAVVRSYSTDGMGLIQYAGGMPVRYMLPGGSGSDEPVGIWAVEANDANPNVEAPDDTRVIHNATGVAFTPVWAEGEEQAIRVDLWAATGYTDEGQPAWVRIATATFDPGDETEWQVQVGLRDVTLQVVSGADEDHPVTIYAAAY